MALNTKWEEITHENDICQDNMYFQTTRMKVIGGWLIRELILMDVEKSNDKWQQPVCALTFISDAEHLWEVELD